MNNIILSFLAVTICLAAVAQRPVLHPGLRTASYKPQKALAEPLKALSGIAEPRPHNRLSASPRRRDLTVIDLGTASNALSYGYAGGQRTMVWADDSLKAVTAMG